MSTRVQIPMKPAAIPARSLKRAQSAILRRKCACGASLNAGGECAECEKKRLQRSAADHAPEFAPPIVHDVLRSPGQPLDSATRAFMEPRFGHDFSRVRLHSDPRANESARAVSANAYTVGNEIVFANRPSGLGDSAGSRLIAHELSHVVQQSGRRHGSGELQVGAADSAQEREADQAARSVVSGRLDKALMRLGSPSIQRDPAPTPTPAPGGSASAPAPSAANCGNDGRPLTPQERSVAEFVFGSSLNLDPICITESSAMTVNWKLKPGQYYRTPGNTIYVGPGQKDTIPMATVIHELTHSYQAQHGVPLATKTAYAVIANYDYGGEQGLINAIAAKKCFSSFNTEQQADIVKDYYVRASSNQSTYPWSVFINQVRAQGACIWPSQPTPAPEPNKPAPGTATG